MKRHILFSSFKVIGFVIINLSLILPSPGLSQDILSSQYNRDTLLTAARELMSSTRYCALITVDESGHPNVRTMDPFTADKDMVVWFGTNTTSRKVKEIKNDSRVTLYYEAANGAGYIVIKGHAFVVNDREKKKRYWKKEWEAYYSEQKENYILLRVVPDRLEIVDYSNGIIGDSDTWAVPFVEFDSAD